MTQVNIVGNMREKVSTSLNKTHDNGCVVLIHLKTDVLLKIVKFRSKLCYLMILGKDE